MTYASTSIDRRADYYARCASLIAADPLDFYTRAEKGRRFQASRVKPQATRGTQISSVASSNTADSQWWKGRKNEAALGDTSRLADGALAA